MKITPKLALQNNKSNNFLKLLFSMRKRLDKKNSNLINSEKKSLNLNLRMVNFEDKLNLFWKKETQTTVMDFHPCSKEMKNKLSAMLKKYRIYST